ncbi:MAG: TetR/AcrR family transcriptional regulator [Pseudomonadota bacterium]
MRTEKQAARRAEIEDAAFRILLEKGYAATSMLSVAQAAGASNETLYRWYGDKVGLFKALVERNALSISAPLSAAIEAGAPPSKVLQKIGPKLLALLTGDRAVALNRAAAADADQTGVLGATLAKSGRNSVKPLFVQLFSASVGRVEAEAVAETYLSLLIGETQTHRVTGARKLLRRTEIDLRAAHAWHCLRAIYPQVA